ncbi:MAG TPA: NAD-dependent epimerase [Candidatus Peribacter riflensis]|uniref:dTDP-glucose 4,6-dehydratase n=1 Tax=Candidatus Peribacter riflensis TaxID=1735162 RepID=A0A0S1ST38_9BACT|nr:MAG: NAD dependent epimerase/dehydratase family [Candidatus Peribacter riflensis]OGJ79197.1 MAG: NAD-dependent epimerase [Candidatus Peribacteria bacterium RIFOXYB1_FULL_57_12]OGJ82607.1 MAG: NAD-dependent epimerase [Candidatus Peribacteria bacterium RIFOXYC1_FULL_58_8]ALM11359.1 MAG: NAD dependent epimerase/dehydratase family protein [Candidatus Peribacter riflensis]ALM12461.1 MAG: NAD dependent epimerase/dehydratase family protein [Candidatus Peribacter riflensis]
MKRVLLTGIDGFIGHHFAEGILKKHPDWKLIGLSKIDSASTLHRLTDIALWSKQFAGRVEFVYHDLRAPVNPYVANRIGPVNYIFHLAASTHVDRSIEYPMEFVMDNVVGTGNLLDYARTLDGLELFSYFSTDEVFGPAPEGVAYKEWDRYKASNPYAATKAGGEELAYSYFNTFGLPVVITHTMNVFGERQHPEKFIPKVINAALHGERLFVHSDPSRTKAGTRFYVHARNVAAAMLFLIEQHEKGFPVLGDKFNIVGEKEVDNLTLAQFIAKTVGKELKYELVDFHSSRPGHDLRYALDGTKLREMGFQYPKTFEQSLEKTVQWYVEHPDWLLADFSKAQFAKEAQAFASASLLKRTVKGAAGQEERGVSSEH